MQALRLIIRTLLFSVGLFILLYFAAVLAGGLIMSKEAPAGGGDEIVIYLENNGRHLDIWLPSEICGYPAAGWLSYGWGDRDFFLSTPYADDADLTVLLRALFLPSPAVIAVGFSDTVPRANDISALAVGRDHAEAAYELISSYFITSDSARGTRQRVPDELVHPSYGDLVFYEAEGRYSIFFTCNNWTGRILKAAGVKSGLWTPLTFGVYRK